VSDGILVGVLWDELPWLIGSPPRPVEVGRTRAVHLAKILLALPSGELIAVSLLRYR
jgi:hypothetical protein